MTTHTYTVLFERFEDEGRNDYIVRVPALPGCVTWGHTLEEAHETAADAIQCYLEGMLKDHEPIPEDVSQSEIVPTKRVSVPIPA